MEPQQESETKNEAAIAAEIDRLFNICQTGFRDEREDAAEALVKFGPRIIPALIESLKDATESNIKFGGPYDIKMLGKLGEIAVAPLLTVITNPTNSEVQRKRAIIALSNTGTTNPQVIDIMGNTLIDPNSSSNIREGADRVFSRLHNSQSLPYLITALKSGYLRPYTSWSIHWLGSIALQPLLTLLQDHTLREEDMTGTVIPALANLKEIAYPHLVELLSHPDQAVQTRAYWALARMRSPIALDFLLEILKKENSWNKLDNIVNILGEIGDSRAIEPLAQRFADISTGMSLRENLGLALSQLDNLKVLEALRPIYLSPDRKRYEWTITSLRTGLDDPVYSFQDILLGDDEAVYQQTLEVLKEATIPATPENKVLGVKLEPLIAALNHPEMTIREASARALGEIESSSHNPQVIAALVETLNDASLPVRIAVIWALGKVGDAETAEHLAAMLDKDKDLIPEERSEVAQALARLGDKRALSVLIEIFTKEAKTRGTIIKLFEKLDDSAAYEPLLQLVYGKLGRSGQVINAVDSLVALKYPKVYDLLVNLTKSESIDLRQCGCEGLGNLGDPRALLLLREMEVHDEGFDLGVNVSNAARDAIDKIRGCYTPIQYPRSDNKKRRYRWTHI